MSHSFTPDTHATVTTSCGLTVTVCCPHAAPVVLPPDGGCCGPTPDPLPDPVTPPVEPGGPATLSAAVAPDHVVDETPKGGILDALLPVLVDKGRELLAAAAKRLADWLKK